jgi:hypothetical protein
MSDERVDAIKAEVRRFEVERDIFNRSLQHFLEWHLRMLSTFTWQRNAVRTSHTAAS